jgi:hypothetical protein
MCRWSPLVVSFVAGGRPMRPRQQTARHRWPALINTPQRSEGAWESCLARNAACGRGRFLLNGVGAKRQGPRCQVLLRRGCNRWCGFRQGDAGVCHRHHGGGQGRTGRAPRCPQRLDIPGVNPKTQRPRRFRAGQSVSERLSSTRCAIQATRAMTDDDLRAETCHLHRCGKVGHCLIPLTPLASRQPSRRNTR